MWRAPVTLNGELRHSEKTVDPWGFKPVNFLLSGNSADAMFSLLLLNSKTLLDTMTFTHPGLSFHVVLL